MAELARQLCEITDSPVTGDRKTWNAMAMEVEDTYIHSSKLLASVKLLGEHLDMPSMRCSLPAVNAQPVEMLPASS